MGQPAPYHLLGDSRRAALILVAGPNYRRIQEIVTKVGIVFDMRHYSSDVDVSALKDEIAREGRPIVVFASMAEVEGRLDRSAFDGRLTDLAYAADRIVYVGVTGAALVHPATPGTRQEIRNGNLTVIQHLDVVAAGETVVGLTVDSL
ncbi:hypothetical protein SEA_SATIS_213 [Streptomyces phage Satis]|nr:hypothetical protein SEA_SATIS_213 [Streptomyces phage Satis]QBZ72101.1 hypothetical protein SEA_KRADAL_215 [Streptomyces phage Kradal]QPL14521.1 hypothetical protein SEA_EHYELIMAYOE_216 [Streptomyces phage EhyElimayoE]